MTCFCLSPGTLCSSCFERCQEQAFSVPRVALRALSLGLGGAGRAGGATGGGGLPAAALRPRPATSVSRPPVFPLLHRPSFFGLPATGLGPPHGRGASCRQGRGPTREAPPSASNATTLPLGPADRGPRPRGLWREELPRHLSRGFGRSFLVPACPGRVHRPWACREDGL